MTKSTDIGLTDECPDNYTSGGEWLGRRFLAKVTMDLADTKFPEEKGLESLEKKFMVAIIATAYGFNIDWVELRDYEDGRGPVMDARHFLCWILKNKWDMTPSEIGHLMNRHHSTVINSIKKVEDLADVDAEFNDKTKKAVKGLTTIKVYYNEQTT